MEITYNVIQSMKHIVKYREMFVSVGINYANAILEAGNCEDAIRISTEIMQDQQSWKMMERYLLSTFVLARGTWASGHQDEAVEWLKKAFYGQIYMKC